MCLNCWSKILGVDWCFCFDYVIFDRNIGGVYIISLIVIVVMGLIIIIEIFGSIGNVWRSFEMFLEVVDDLKVS